MITSSPSSTHGSLRPAPTQRPPEQLPLMHCTANSQVSPASRFESHLELMHTIPSPIADISSDEHCASCEHESPRPPSAASKTLEAVLAHALRHRRLVALRVAHLAPVDDRRRGTPVVGVVVVARPRRAATAAVVVTGAPARLGAGERRACELDRQFVRRTRHRREGDRQGRRHRDRVSAELAAVASALRLPASAAVNPRCAFCERRQRGAACRPNQRQLARKGGLQTCAARAPPARQGGGWE